MIMRLPASILLFTALTGCADDPPREKFGTLEGEVTSIHTGPVPELDAVLLWKTLDEDGARIVGATAPLTAEFPAKFALELLAPPPQAELWTDPASGAQISLGLIVAMPRGLVLDQSVSDEELAQQRRGAVPSQIVIFTSTPILPGNVFEEWLAGPLEQRGYHVRRIDPVIPEELAEIYACRAALPACEYDDPSDSRCVEPWDDCGLILDSLLPAQPDEEISLVLGSPDEVRLPNLLN